jgi:hypothetical protein
MRRVQYLKNLCLLLLLPGLFFSCSKEEFATKRGQQTETVPQVVRASSNVCSNFTLIRPKVDLLFLWDNSTSSFFINEQTRQSLNRLVENVSDRFDYHIVLAPLNRATTSSVNHQMKFVSFDDQGIAPQIMHLRRSKEDAFNQLNFNHVGGNIEKGVDRAQEIIAGNITNGLFRQGAHTLIVLLSTEDHNFYPSFEGSGGNRLDPNEIKLHVNHKTHELLCLRGNYGHTYNDGYTGPYGADCSGLSTPLNSTMMRFISIVAHNESLCTQNEIYHSKRGQMYIDVSRNIYEEPYTNNITTPSDQFGQNPDSTDVCQRNYNSIFDGVNSAIQDTVIAHSYNFWPVDQSSRSVDPATIKVRKGTGQEFFSIPNNVIINVGNDTDQNNNPVNGWRYIGIQNNFPTRYAPTVGEHYSGHLIQLFGQAKVTYPECLQVTYDSEIRYIGYVHIAGRPVVDSINLKVNEQIVLRCQNSTSTNCWELELSGGQPHYQTNKNIMIQGPGNFTPASPPVLKTGYFLRLRGNVIIKSGETVKVDWTPAGS